MATKIKKVVFISDLHVPEHDVEAWNNTLDFLDDYQPDILILGGDIGEFESVSSHGGVLEPPMLEQDVADLHMILVDLLDRYQQTKFVYLFGNHENRIKRTVTKLLPQAASTLKLSNLLGLEELGIEWHDEGIVYSVGNLNFVHGLWTSVHHAKKHLEAFNRNIMYGHTHRFNCFLKGLPEGEYMAGYGAPTLRDLDAGYLKHYPSGWTQGFIVAEVDEESDISNVYPVIMHKKKFIFNGKVYGGKDANSDKHK